MSNRAEEFARKLYTPWSEDGMSRKDNTEVIEACIKGYEQALSDIKNLIDSNIMPPYAGKIIRLIEQNCE